MNVVEEMAVAVGHPEAAHLDRARIPTRTRSLPGNDEHGANIAVTQGLLTTVIRDELQAVIGHEMGHIKNLDVR